MGPPWHYLDIHVTLCLTTFCPKYNTFSLFFDFLKLKHTLKCCPQDVVYVKQVFLEISTIRLVMFYDTFSKPLTPTLRCHELWKRSLQTLYLNHGNDVNYSIHDLSFMLLTLFVQLQSVSRFCYLKRKHYFNFF